MNLIFDFDGVIADSLPVVLEIANPELKKMGKKPLTKQGIRNTGIKQILAQHNIGKLRTLFILLRARHELKKRIADVKVFPKMIPAINSLSKSHTLGIITSNSRSNAEHVLKAAGIENKFEFIDTSINMFGKHKKILSAIKKYDLSAKDTIYIGDETRDIEAAKKAGIKIVATTWGFEDKKILQAAAPDKTIVNPSFLVDAITHISRH